MKWPASITFIRHGQSAYNVLKEQKAMDPEYAEFKEAYRQDHESEAVRLLARRMTERYALKTSDYETDLSDAGKQQSLVTGRRLQEGAIAAYRKPDVVLVSPYLRTRRTFDYMVEGGLDVAGAKIVFEDRIREQEHGLSLLYSDWRIFHIFHPEQKRLLDLLGPYWYPYPQGESVSQVRERIRSVTNTLVREYAEMNVMLVSHHLTKLAFRSIHERLSPEEFVRLDREEKPFNCGITIYHGNPDRGSNGKLKLKVYNETLY
jgi:broad specificity phosphatase PhoE